MKTFAAEREVVIDARKYDRRQLAVSFWWSSGVLREAPKQNFIARHCEHSEKRSLGRKDAMLLKRIMAISALAVVAVVLSLPTLVQGPMLSAHDTKEHLTFGEYFAEQFWQGELYPRWLLNMNHGLGSASFFIYPPFPSYVYTLLQPAARIIHLNAFSLEEYFCLLTSGLCAYAWMTTLASRFISVMASAIYMLLPYHLTIDFYRRGAISECWALAWMPLVLYFTTQVVRKKPYAVAALALSYTLLIVSHLVSVFILSALPLLLALTTAERGLKAKAFLSVIGCLVLGAIASGAYLVPAITNARYFPVSRLDIPIDIGPGGNLLAFGCDLWTRHSENSKFMLAILLATVSTALFIALCGLVSLSKGPHSRRVQTILWLAVCPIPLFLMSSWSLWVWKAVPVLTTAAQFPWRFDVVLCVAAIPLSAFLLTDLMKMPGRSRLAVLIVVVCFASTWFAGYVYTVRRLALGRKDPGATLSVHDGWFAAWTPRGMNQNNALAASTGPDAVFLAGHGSATVLIWKPRNIEVLTNCTACGPLIVKQLYYPKWRARLVQGGPSLPVGPALPQGLIELQVPPGRQQLLLEMPRGIDEKLGNWLSACGIIVCIIFAVPDLARGHLWFRP